MITIDHDSLLDSLVVTWLVHVFVALVNWFCMPVVPMFRCSNVNFTFMQVMH